MIKNRPIIVIFVTLGISGCVEPDGRLADLAEQTTAQQAQQNRDMTQANARLVDTTRQLAERDAVARQELTALQKAIRQDQAEVGRQRDMLESERRTVAADRQRESTWGAVLLSTAFVLAALSPFVLAGVALWIVWRTPDDSACGLVVLEDLASRSSLLSATPSSVPRIESREVPNVADQTSGDRHSGE